MIGAYARLHVVHRALCESGPYLTIRLNRFSSVGIQDLANNGLAPSEILDYLRAIVRSGQTLLVVGEVGTGKTTLSRALAGAIPEGEAILVIEDTPEIRLEHPHVRYVRTREENTDGAGRITPNECIRGGMRMAMNRIIFGEIRDAEAAEAFVDVCASGHPGISTIHARSATEAITRLELFLGRAQKGVGRAVLNEQIVTAVQVVVFVDFCHQTGRRRIMEVKEIGPVADGVIRQRDIFKYQVVGNLPQWRVLNKISAHREDLESEEHQVFLSRLGNTLELDPSVALREASRRKAA
jgi:pilus assembly protein CpaF